MLCTIHLLKYPSFDMRSPQILIGLLRLWLFSGMLLASFSFSVMAQETPITTPIPSNTPTSSASQSGMRLGVQTAQNGNTYLNWIMVPPTKGPSPINSDIEWLADNLNKGVASPPVMMPPAPLPMSGAPSAVRSIDIDVCNAHRHSFQIHGRLPTVLSIPHKNEPYECVDDRIHTSFDIAEGFASNLFVSKTGICEICKESPPSKAFSLTEGRYNIGYDENVAYHEIDWALYNRGAMRTILWQVIDKKGNALLGKYLGVGGEEGKAQRSYDRTTYNGGNYVRITPLTFEAGAQSHELSSARYERFAFYKEVADLAYYGEKGDKVSLYQGENEADGGTDDTEVLREQPWTIGGSFSGHGPFEYNKLEAEIVEVIEGPLHAPDVFNSLTPDYFLISIGLDDDYSPFGKIIHPFCGEIPVDYRAVILRTNPKRKGFSRYILALKGSNYNRSDWIHTDIPQYFGAIPEQYRFSKKVAEYVEKINNWPRGDGQPLTVVGHSLGGGMAQYIVGTNRAESSFAGTWMDNDRRSSTQSMNSTRMSRQGTWWGFAFNPATLGTGTSAEVAFASRSDTPMSRFTVIRNSNDIVSNAAGRLLGNIWVLESGGHSLGSMDLTRILTVLPAPSQKFSLDASANLTISSPPLLPGFVNQQFADLDKP